MLELILAKAISGVRALSLSTLSRLCKTDESRHAFMEVYVVCFSVLLTIIVNLSPAIPLGAAVIAGYCILDIVSYRVFFVFVKSKQEPWGSAVIRRSLLLAGINLYELVVAFGILYVYSGQVKNGDKVLADPLGAAYFSAVTMFTIGYGDFVPVGSVARSLVLAQLASGLVMLGFIVPAILAAFPGAQRDGEPPKH